MAKRESKFIRDMKKKMAIDMARNTRKWKKDAFEKVKVKEKIETFGDIYAVFCGLSKNAIEIAAYRRIEYLAYLGNSPMKIIEIMEPDRKRGNAK